MALHIDTVQMAFTKITKKTPSGVMMELLNILALMHTMVWVSDSFYCLDGICFAVIKKERNVFLSVT